MANTLAPLAVTMGEPAGIGPDIILKTHAIAAAEKLPAFMVAGCAKTLQSRAQQMGLDSINIISVASADGVREAMVDGLAVLDRPLPSPAEPGQPKLDHAPHVIRWIDEAVSLALGGSASGVVTGPIQKEALYAAGFTHQGHTDYIAHLARQAGQDANPVMMLSAGDFRTVPLTVHIPLAEVAPQITTDSIVSQATIIHDDLKRYFAIRSPRIAVAGLNPHAGENRSIGSEDADIIAPAIEQLKANGINAFGPLPADTLFHEQARAQYDLALCMYHDQALIPIKTIGFYDGVNTTLGLPFVRTSPDHGTALEIAGTGRANPSSLIAALHQAHAMALATQ